MISDRMRQLLAAYVDGELPARQREAATRLLEQSAEAREFIRHLEADAAALRRLPRRQLAPDFSEKVLGAIGDRRARGFRHARLARAPVYPAWIGVAAAASVLFVIGVGSALYFYALPGRPDKVVVAKNDDLRLDDPPQAPKDTQRKSSTPSPQENQPPEPSSNPPEPIKDNQSANEKDRPILEFTPDADFTLDTSPMPRLEVFNELVEVKLALNLTLADLDQPRLQERLRDKLKEDKAFQLDLSCPANAKGLDRLEAAFQAKGVKVVIDRAALARWKKGLKTNYAFYMEDLTPEELTRFLQDLGAEDKKVEPKQRFNKILINHLTPADRKELCSLLGVDPRAMPAKAAQQKGPLGVDLTQPLSKKTEEQVADALAGKGPPRPKPGEKATAKVPDRLALVLSYNPVRAAPSSSKEIKQFLATRPGQRPGAVQVLLVLRGK